MVRRAFRSTGNETQPYAHITRRLERNQSAIAYVRAYLGISGSCGAFLGHLPHLTPRIIREVDNQRRHHERRTKQRKKLQTKENIFY